jgi:hypothetical protein
MPRKFPVYLSQEQVDQWVPALLAYQHATDVLSHDPTRDQAYRMAQGTPVEQGIVKTATSSNTPPLQRIGAYQNIVQNALSDLESQHTPALASVAKNPVDTVPIVSRLQSLKSATMATMTTWSKPQGRTSRRSRGRKPT